MIRSTPVGRFRTLAVVVALLVGAAGSGFSAATLAQEATPAGTGEQSEFFVQEEFERQLAQRDIKPEGPADQPWIQAIEPEYVDTG